MSKPPGANCEIVIAATIGEACSTWFEDFDVATEGSNSRLVGRVIDQAALHGVLGRLRDLGIPILDVHMTPRSPATEEGSRRNTPVGTRRGGLRSIRSDVPDSKEDGQ